MSETTELHERRVAIAVAPRGDGFEVHAELRDLRKVEMSSFRGPLDPGVVHHMFLDAEIDASRTIRQVDTRMQTIPFEKGPQTRGEGCRDILPGFQKLVGATLDASYALRVNELIGGPFGCFHILSLAQCLPLAVGEVADHHHEPVEREMRITALGSDSPLLGMRGALRDEAASGAQTAELFVRIDPKRFVIADSPVAGLAGLSITKGFTRNALDVLEKAGGAFAPRHLAALVIALTPVIPQAVAALSGFHRVPRTWSTGPGSPQVDSCHMWRSEGPVVDLIRELSRPAGEKV